MWLAPLVHLLTLVAVEPQANGSPPPAAPARPAPTFTNRTVFTIPFHIDRPARIAQEPVEVRLYVSSNHGHRGNCTTRPSRPRGSFSSAPLWTENTGF